MTTAILIAVLAPIVAAGGLLPVARRRLPKPAADSRGIALQTIIVMVVLLGIAGAVVVVLATRAGEEQDRLDEVDIDYTQWNGEETQCELAGGTYDGTANTCGP